MKVTFGRESGSGSNNEYPVLLDGVRIGEITSSSYDRHHRRSTEIGYEASFYHAGKRIKASGRYLRDVKESIIGQLIAKECV